MNEAFHGYIAAGPARQQALFGRLQEIVLDNYPDDRQGLCYNLPAFRRGRGQESPGYRKYGVTLCTTAAAHIDPIHPCS